MKTKEAAQAAINKAWEPMAKAKSITAINKIWWTTDSGPILRCKKEFDHFCACMKVNDFPAAAAAAAAVCERLRGIVKGDE